MATTKIVLLSDSTNGWFAYTANRRLYLPEYLYSTYRNTIKTAECSTIDGAYQSLTTAYWGGVGADEIHLYDGSVGGQWVVDYDDPTVLAARVTAVSPDVVITALGINGATGAGTADLISSIKSVAPTANILVVAQNPTTSEGLSGSGDRRDTIQADAASESATFIDVYQAYANTGDWESYLADAVHPNADGLQLYSDVVGPVVGGLGLISEVEAPVAVLDDAVLLLRALNYSGSGDWLDESGNGYDAVPSGSPTYADGAFTLNGTNQFFTVADQDEFDVGVGESLTALVACTFDADETDSAPITKRNNGYPGWAYSINPSEGASATGYFTDTTNTSAGSISSSLPALDDGEVHVVGMRFDQGGYADGIYDDTINVNGRDISNIGAMVAGASAPVYIGKWQYGGYHKGKIIAAAIWDYKLSDAEVAAAVAALPIEYQVSEAATLHGDKLLEWIYANVSPTRFTDTELVGILNQINGTTGKEYAEARGTFLGVPAAG